MVINLILNLYGRHVILSVVFLLVSLHCRKQQVDFKRGKTK